MTAAGAVWYQPVPGPAIFSPDWARGLMPGTALVISVGTAAETAGPDQRTRSVRCSNRESSPARPCPVTVAAPSRGLPGRRYWNHAHGQLAGPCSWASPGSACWRSSSPRHAARPPCWSRSSATACSAWRCWPWALIDVHPAAARYHDRALAVILGVIAGRRRIRLRRRVRRYRHGGLRVRGGDDGRRRYQPGRGPGGDRSRHPGDRGQRAGFRRQATAPCSGSRRSCCPAW